MITVLAESAVFNFGFAVVDQDIWTARDKLTIQEARVERGFAAAITNSFNLFEFMRNLQEAGGSFEAAVVLTKIKTQTVANDWNIKIDDDLH